MIEAQERLTRQIAAYAAIEGKAELGWIFASACGCKGVAEEVSVPSKTA